jgi:DNA-binding CsgD family transcriptional regulator
VLPAPELATRLRPSAPEVLMASHDLPLGVLTQNSRDSLAPNGDIRATLEWGYYPLTDAERVVFERPNAASGWTLQAADAHCLLHNPLVLGAAFAAGRAMGREEAMRLARQADGEPVPSGERTITAREREVAVLIAKGLSNQQIAEHLVIAPSTANRHVANILCKLGFSSRARIATWVTERRVHGHGFRAAN